jgi:hypothetical protein
MKSDDMRVSSVLLTGIGDSGQLEAVLSKATVKNNTAVVELILLSMDQGRASFRKC